MSNDVSTGYTTHKLGPADWLAFKGIRLEALQQEAAVFSSSYAREAAFNDMEWQNRLGNPEAAFFGLYHLHELIGVTGIITWQDEPSGAKLIASYIRAGHRGKGLSALLYQARIAWAKAEGFKVLFVSHRKSNGRSKAANQHFGFRYTHSELMEWPDGQQEEIVSYRLDLYPDV